MPQHLMLPCWGPRKEQPPSSQQLLNWEAGRKEKTGFPSRGSILIFHYRSLKEIKTEEAWGVTKVIQGGSRSPSASILEHEVLPAGRLICKAWLPRPVELWLRTPGALPSPAKLRPQTISIGWNVALRNQHIIKWRRKRPLPSLPWPSHWTRLWRLGPTR